MTSKDGITNEVVEASEHEVTNGSDLRTTSAIGYVTPPIVLHLCSLITSDFNPKS